MAKITKTQFENWSKDFKKKLDSYLNSASDKLTPEEYAELVSLISHITWGVKKQIPLAVMTFISFYESLPGHDSIKNDVYSDTDGLTLQQWLDNIKQKLKEHAEAGGYYKPSEPMDSEEDSDRIAETKAFLKQLQETVKVNDDLSDIKENSNMLNEYPFLMKDLIGRVEQAQQKLTEAEEKQKGKGNTTNKPQDNNKLN
nr:5888_t:CDS:2 [Entrophospora candida]